MKGKKLKNRIIISGDSGISKNNIPCEDYHLNIRQDIGDPTKVIFEYIPPKKYKRSVLKNDEDVKNFISFLEHQGEFLPGDCSKKSFSKTLCFSDSCSAPRSIRVFLRRAALLGRVL